MKQKSLLTTLILLIGLGSYTILNTSYSGGWASNGGYQNGGCSCHGPSNAATTVNINGLPTFYNVNTVYPITVTVSNVTKVAAGFQVKTNIGTLTMPGTGVVIFPDTKSAGHNQRKTMVSGTATFMLSWTSPAVGGTAATFEAAGNAVDNSFNNSGDQWNTAASSNVALTVDFVAITAVQKKHHVEINFTTASEENISHFEIQKSIDGINFETNATMTTNENGEYTFSDFEVTNGTTFYYRIKEIGMDNTFSFSKVATIKFKSETAISIYPTVIENNRLNIIGMANDNLKLVLFDFMGRKVFTANNVSSNIELPQMTSGFYFVTILENAEVLKTQKLFIK